MHFRRAVCCYVSLGIGFVTLAITSVVAAEIAPKQIDHFESCIRPVLVAQCYACHNSHDLREGELALDHRDALRAGGANGPIVVPGKPEESQLLAILRHEIPGLEMPQDGPRLDPQTIADFERWIADGAVDPRDEPPSEDQLATATSWEQTLERRKQWWSLQPIARPTPPAVDDPRWTQHPIDQFIEAGRRSAGLTAGDRAAPAVLVRRLYLVLTGLPPTSDEAQHWTDRLTDASEGQYQDRVAELVDQLLASPRYAERWARHWMDWIRYAESHGSEGDPEIVEAWRYRDYLIRALDADVPVDQLLQEHVAGDLLATPRRNEALGINESAIGTAHWRMVFHGFAPTDALDEKVRFIDDQINTFSKAFLGLTVSCARCHNHKFDAISQRDYYALFGVLGSCRPGRRVVDLPERIDVHRGELEALKEEIRTATADAWQASMDGLAARILAAEGDWEDSSNQALYRPLLVLHAAVEEGQAPGDAWREIVATHAARSEVQASFDEATLWSADLSDPAIYAQWFRAGSGLPEHPQPAGNFSVAPAGDAALLGIYPSGVTTHRVSTKHAARLMSEDLDLREPAELWVLAAGDKQARMRYVVQDYPRNGTVYRLSTLTPDWRWQRLDLSYWQGDRIHIELTTAKDAPLLVVNESRSWFAVRAARLVRPGVGPPAPGPAVLDPVFRRAEADPPTSLEDLAHVYAAAVGDAVLAWQGGTLSDEQALLLDACRQAGLLSNDVASLADARPLIERYRQLEGEIPVATRVPGLDEATPQDQPLFIRGDHRQPSDPTPRRFLEAIDSTPYDDSESGRLQLAADLLRDDNPLTRRVLVNRIWHHLFGQGIVRTPNNFGKLGDEPSHPELLDWLATHFVESGWSMKRLIREIVLTETWQLSSQPPEGAISQDPENRLLSYRTVQRLEAEAIRDLLLALSGELQHQLGGRPVEGSTPRRSIYVRVQRNALDPLLRTYDFPEPFTAVGRRSATNVPAQALALLNDPQVAKWARSWATAIVGDRSLDTDQGRIAQMYRAAFGRSPTEGEIARCQEFLAQSRTRIDQRRNERERLERVLAEHEQAIEAILAPLREQLSAERKPTPTDAPSDRPEPIGAWDFIDSAEDRRGTADAQLNEGAQRSQEGLVIRNGGYAVTSPLPFALAEKTLAAWVQLDQLEQRGGGVMTVQTLDGTYFDAIVFGEKTPRHWLAGSNNFARTQPFEGLPEQEAAAQPVHLAIAYHADGQVVGYRNGQPYGKPFKSNGPFRFEQGRAVVSFGVRHLPPVGNRLLSGRILQARLYDRALDAAQIAAEAYAGPPLISRQQIVDALSPDRRARLEQLEADQAAAAATLQRFDGQDAAVDAAGAWSELALALVTLKELIYVR